MFHIRARLTNILLAGMDSVILLAAFLTVLTLRVSPHRWPVLLFVFCLLFPVCLFSFSYFGLYNSRRAGACFSDLLILTKGIVLATVLLTVINVLLKDLSLNLSFLNLFPAVALFGLASYRTVMRLILRRLRERGINTKKLILVGLNPLVDQILERITTHPFYGYEVIGVFGCRSTGQTKCPQRGEIDDFISNLDQCHPDEVIIALPFELSSKLPDLIKACESQGVQARIVDSLSSVMGTRGQVCDLDGIRLVSAYTYPTERLDYLILKRLLDVIVSLFLLVLLSPLLLLLALCAKFSSKGSILFRQQRVGLNGRRFWMLKFRTMTQVEDAVSDIEWVPQSIDRFTPFGKFLRRTNMDELPQLLNVLRGQMSLVGPRPERPFYTELFRKEVPQYMLRHYIQCGITGWAQINGWRGNTSIQRRIEHDLYYLKNWGLWFDIKILAFTLFRRVAPAGGKV